MADFWSLDFVVQKDSLQVFLDCLETHPVELFNLLCSIGHSRTDVIAIREIAEAASGKVIQEDIDVRHASKRLFCP
jgi:hypothetical protein